MSPTPVIHPPKAFHLRNQETAVPCAQIVHMKSCYLWPAVFGGKPQRRERERERVREREKKKAEPVVFQQVWFDSHARKGKAINREKWRGRSRWFFFKSGSEDANTLKSYKHSGGVSGCHSQQQTTIITHGRVELYCSGQGPLPTEGYWVISPTSTAKL